MSLISKYYAIEVSCFGSQYGSFKMETMLLNSGLQDVKPFEMSFPLLAVQVEAVCKTRFRTQLLAVFFISFTETPAFTESIFLKVSIFWGILSYLR